jgi:hypothetical protein
VNNSVLHLYIYLLSFSASMGYYAALSMDSDPEVEEEGETEGSEGSGVHVPVDGVKKGGVDVVDSNISARLSLKAKQRRELRAKRKAVKNKREKVSSGNVIDEPLSVRNFDGSGIEAEVIHIPEETRWEEEEQDSTEFVGPEEDKHEQTNSSSTPIEFDDNGSSDNESDMEGYVEIDESPWNETEYNSSTFIGGRLASNTSGSSKGRLLFLLLLPNTSSSFDHMFLLLFYWPK